MDNKGQTKILIVYFVEGIMNSTTNKEDFNMLDFENIGYDDSEKNISASNKDNRKNESYDDQDNSIDVSLVNVIADSMMN